MIFVICVLHVLGFFFNNCMFAPRGIKVIVIILALLIITFYFIEIDHHTTEFFNPCLESDGIAKLSGRSSNYPFDAALSILPEDYVVMDYVYEIKGTSLSTFHRDVTSSKNVYSTSHPVYTLILYKYNGHHISYCPGSHKQYPFVFNRIHNVYGKAETAYLFDCDLLHAGGGGDNINRHVIQYKICHKNDVNKLNHLQGIKTNKNGDANTPYRSRLVTYFFQFPINYIFTPFLIEKYPSDTIMGRLQSIIDINFYNNI